MKTLTLSILFVVAFSCCNGQDYLSRRSCSSHKECKSGCCRVYLRGKKRSASGVCEPYGSSGSVCHLNPLQLDGPVSGSCPCAKGLLCKSAGYIDVPNGEVGHCRPKDCQTSNDCAFDECCVNPNRPIGKRRRRQVSFATGNECQKLKLGGESCLVSYGSGQPVDLVFMCPCKSGSTCTPNGFNDMPLGPLGTCSFTKG